MLGIDAHVILHYLVVDKKHKHEIQKWQSFNAERAIKEKVSRLLAAVFIREVKYHT